MVAFRQDYDLNVLYKKFKAGETIDRQDLDIKDARSIQLLLLQLKQFLLMMQASGTERAEEAVQRFRMLKLMWNVEKIHHEFSTTSSQINQGLVVDPKIIANKQPIQVISQILKIVNEDASYLENHVSKQGMQNLQLKQPSNDKSQVVSDRNTNNNFNTEEAALEVQASHSSRQTAGVYNKNFMTSLRSQNRNDLKLMPQQSAESHNTLSNRSASARKMQLNQALQKQTTGRMKQQRQGSRRTGLGAAGQ